MRYIHGEWDHLFNFRSSPVDVRFVFDTLSGQIVEMDLHLAGNYSPALKNEIADVEHSLKSANEEVFSTPVQFGLERSNLPPEWSRLAAAARALT
ncbi:hypothetical protein [Duganella vulcania]|uniref:Uncharacterized protein n=1 Tax=Duganella vulcania TaxID=2692166 RepID=A0A845GDW8_9BURK|nr:hypothetical protein [Duganella vulcania]MYM92474.1 hypothetical protein [Duganella vulcania]